MQVVRRAVAAGVRFTSAQNLLGSDLPKNPLQQSGFPVSLPSFGLHKAHVICKLESTGYSVTAKGFLELLLKVREVLRLRHFADFLVFPTAPLRRIARLRYYKQSMW